MYNQIVIWPGTVVGADNVEKFERWMEENGFSAKYLEEFTTIADEYGNHAGRNELLFDILGDTDIGKFSVWRLQYGMRWWEDYLDNGNDSIVPPAVLNKYPYGWDNTPEKYVR